MGVHPIDLYDDCGPSAVAILTGKGIAHARARIVALRRKGGRYNLGAPKSKNVEDTQWTYLPELRRALLADNIRLGKFRKFGGRVKAFAAKYPRGTYFLNFTNHVAIYRDGEIYDNMGHGIPPEFYRYRRFTLQSFAKVI